MGELKNMGLLDTLKSIDDLIDTYVEARDSTRNKINQIETSANKLYSKTTNIKSNIQKAFEQTESRRIIEEQIAKIQRKSTALTIFTFLFCISCIIATIVMCVTNNDVILRLIKL